MLWDRFVSHFNKSRSFAERIGCWKSKECVRIKWLSSILTIYQKQTWLPIGEMHQLPSYRLPQNKFILDAKKICLVFPLQTWVRSVNRRDFWVTAKAVPDLRMVGWSKCNPIKHSIWLANSDLHFLECEKVRQFWKLLYMGECGETENTTWFRATG